MKTDVATIQQASPINWESELRGAGMLIKSGLVPKDIRTPEAALFCILAGRDLGLSPVQSLRSIRPIQGKIECSADLQLGLFHRNGGKSRWLKLDSSGAELELSASWLTQPHVSKFGAEDAKRADLMSNANYRKYPQAMFRSRAITQGLKDIGFLIGAGVYAPGEIGGGAVVDEVSGEVLPAAEESSAPAAISDQSGLSGAVESLSDDEREELANVAQSITEAINAQDMETALNAWRARDNDAQTAIWAMLDKPVKKAIRAAVEAARQSEEQAELEAAAGPPSMGYVLSLITSGKLDEAADLVRTMPAADREVLEKQIAARKAKADVV